MSAAPRLLFNKAADHLDLPIQRRTLPPTPQQVVRVVLVTERELHRITVAL